jgi:RNA-directed DNA polymerase
VELAQELVRESTRLIRRYEDQAQRAHDESIRRAKRTAGPTFPVVSKQPPNWAAAEGFNPYLTRSRANRIAHSVRRSLRERQYRPRQPIEYLVPKVSGGDRTVSIFQVADSAVSRITFESLLAKNLPLFSARAYAYRKDVSAQDAVQYVRSEISDRSRMFVAEFDFSAFFDSIEHEHIRRNLRDYKFLMSNVERSVIDAFLTTAPVASTVYIDGVNRDRDRGVPQGTSISLFLANVAAWDLDRSLEHTGVGFTRYADDTLLWSDDYATICRATELLEDHARRMGVQLNLDKSPGIHLLVDNPKKAEMAAVATIDYLGYQIGLKSARVKAGSIDKIKSHIERLVYWNLIHAPMAGTQNSSRIAPHVDRDYVTLLSQIRSYLYGDLSERTVQRFQRGEIPSRRFKGVMAAYPLIDDDEQLIALDGWLVNSLYVAMHRRAKLLAASGIPTSAPPYGHSRSDFARAKTVSARTHETVDMRVPSFRRIARVMRRAASLYGPGRVGRSAPYGSPY